MNRPDETLDRPKWSTTLSYGQLKALAGKDGLLEQRKFSHQTWQALAASGLLTEFLNMVTFGSFQGAQVTFQAVFEQTYTAEILISNNRAVDLFHETFIGMENIESLPYLWGEELEEHKRYEIVLKPFPSIGPRLGTPHFNRGVSEFYSIRGAFYLASPLQVLTYVRNQKDRGALLPRKIIVPLNCAGNPPEGMDGFTIPLIDTGSEKDKPVIHGLQFIENSSHCFHHAYDRSEHPNLESWVALARRIS